MADSIASSSSSHVSTSSAYTTASDGDYWKARGDVCEECGRPWKWAVWCRLCQACRDSEVHLRRVQGQLRIRPPCVISKAESLSARLGFSTEWYSITPCRQALPVAPKANSPQPAVSWSPSKAWTLSRMDPVRFVLWTLPANPQPIAALQTLASPQGASSSTEVRPVKAPPPPPPPAPFEALPMHKPPWAPPVPTSRPPPAVLVTNGVVAYLRSEADMPSAAVHGPRGTAQQLTPL